MNGGGWRRPPEGRTFTGPMRPMVYGVLSRQAGRANSRGSALSQRVFRACPDVACAKAPGENGVVRGLLREGQVTANGLRFAYLEGGSGPLVVLLHGWPDTPHTWDHQLAALAGAGFRVVAQPVRTTW
jgi:hypothetical protein